MSKENMMDGHEKREQEVVEKAAKVEKPPVEEKKPEPPKPPEEDAFMMPPVPKEIRVEGSKDPKLAEMMNGMIRYMTWLGRHFRREDNFICPKCFRYYSPAKKVCPNCNPTGPNVKK